MIQYKNLSKSQQKWLSLVEYYFTDIYKCGIITHAQLKTTHEKFIELRSEGPNFKVGWPIWLIMNNSIGRATYRLPVENMAYDDELEDEDSSSPYYEEYIQELKQFNVIKDESQ